MGVQQVFYLNNGQASHEHTVNYPSSDLDRMASFNDETEGTDDSFTQYKDEAETQLLAYVSAPWAKDAAARDVSTHYELQCNSLAQVIQPNSNDTYPIVVGLLQYRLTVFLVLLSCRWLVAVGEDGFVFHGVSLPEEHCRRLRL